MTGELQPYGEGQDGQQGCYQVTVIGSGPGGYVAAIKAAQLGLKTAVIEQGDVGGTCLNRGCIPTKTLIHTAELYEDVKRARLFGLSVEQAALDFDALRGRKETVCAALRQGVENLLDANGVEVIRGRATILTPTQVMVDQIIQDGIEDECAMGEKDTQAQGVGEGQGAGADVSAEPSTAAEAGGATASPRIVDTETIIIAVGTTPEIPDIEGIDLPGVYTSDSILEEVPPIPRLAVLGGGVIGMEFANIYASYGTEVTVLIASDRPLRSLDRELGQSLSMEMKKKGASIVTRAAVQRIEKGSPLRVVYSVKDEEQVVEADAVLMAKGRVADVRRLLADGLELACEHGRIVVDGDMRTSIEGVYAIGDITDAAPELAHAASAEGVIAACAIAGEACTRRLDLVPTCVYTSPEIACVGMTAAEAKDAGIEARTGKYPMAGNGKTLITDQGRSFIKIVVDEAERVIGAQLMCARATDIIGEIAVGIAAGMTVSEMLEIVRPHPTFEEAVGEALESVAGAAIHSIPRRR